MCSCWWLLQSASPGLSAAKSRLTVWSGIASIPSLCGSLSSVLPNCVTSKTCSRRWTGCRPPLQLRWTSRYLERVSRNRALEQGHGQVPNHWVSRVPQAPQNKSARALAPDGKRRSLQDRTVSATSAMDTRAFSRTDPARRDENGGFQMSGNGVSSRRQDVGLKSMTGCCSVVESRCSAVG